VPTGPQPPGRDRGSPRRRGIHAPVVSFAYIALGIPAVVMWWNIAVQLRRTAAARRRPVATRVVAAGPRSALVELGVEEAA
jgi:hypothetical protein